MRLLLDTHVLLWWLADDARLPGSFRTAIADPATTAVVSAVTVAEIAIKTSLGKLRAPADLLDALSEGGFEQLPLTAEHAERLSSLPWHHRDPFDRMLVAQAQVESLVLATADARCREYDVEVLGADA